MIHSVLRSIVALVIGLALLFEVSTALHAQIANTGGQDVVPVYEGWRKNVDGSHTLFFGYFSRNRDEQIDIAVGPDNGFEPSPVDRGQPTHFYPRRQQFVFAVTVPADWGQKDLVWTLTSRGKTEKAYGSLRDIYEVDNELIAKNMGAGSFGLMLANKDQPPTVTIQPGNVKISARTPTVKLTATVTDDGVPPPVSGSEGGRGADGVFLNVPVKPQPRRPRGLSVSWIEFRGPGQVTFEPEGYQAVVNGGSSSRTATFHAPGTYVLRAIASDSLLFGTADVSITVEP